MASADDVIASLLDAANAATAAHDAAVQDNPGGNFQKLGEAQARANAIAQAAIGCALTGAAGVDAATAAVDAATAEIHGSLQDFKTVAQWLALVNDLVGLAAKAARFLA